MPTSDRSVLRAVLFTDVVGSTEVARDLGDERWAQLLGGVRRVIRAQLKAHAGREVDTAGDGLFALFERPADAVRCALAACEGVQELGIDLRAGVHVGEIESSGTGAHGIVVHTGARAMALAGPAEVVVTQTVKDLVAGARFTFDDRGSHELKGVPGRWQLFTVTGIGDTPAPAALAPDTAAQRRHQITARQVVRPGGRRRLMATGGVLAVALAGLAAFTLWPRTEYIPAGGTVTRIHDGAFEKPVLVGSTPVALTEGDGQVWVLDQQAQVYWVDARTGAVGSRGTDGTPTGVTTGSGSVWITNGFGPGQGPDATVSQLDPRTHQIASAFTTPIGSQAVTYGADAVWVADPNTSTVTHYDTVTQSTRRIPLPSGQLPARPDSVAFATQGGGTVWVGDALAGRVYRVGAGPGHQVRTYTVSGPVSAVAVGDTAVWAASEHDDALYALDPSTGVVRRTVDVGSHGCNAPTSAAVAAEGVWLACSQSQRVVLVDPTTGDVGATLTVAGTPVALAAASDGSVWLAVQPR